MNYLVCILVLVAVLVTAGCTEENQTPLVTPTPQTIVTTIPVTPTAPVTPVSFVTMVSATEEERKITDGYWCRDTTMNIGTASTKIKECYQFFPDGTYKWGFSPGWPMGKSRSCSGDPRVKCTYILNAKGQYEVEGGYYYTLAGDTLIDAHDPPYFLWSAGGIP